MRLADAIAQARSKAAREILQAAGSRAMQRDGETEPSVGVVLLLQGAVATGQRMAQHVQSTPRWLVNHIEEQGASPQAILSFRGAPGNDFAASKVVLRPAADTAIRMAVRLAEASVGRDRFDARHLVVAALDTPDARTAQQMRRDFSAAGVDLAKLRAGLIGKIIDAPENNEDVSLWQRLLDEPAQVWATLSKPASGTPSLPRTSTVASVNTDRTAISSSDPLGINADVTAFARLICLEDARPPLSIGIFGEWGSGKSSFMERLQLEIAELTRKEREARAKTGQATSSGAAQSAPPEAKQATAPRFIENAVQIRFNAWHYADANLWASLTAEFFDQLRRGGYEGQRSKDYLALIGKVAERVRSLEASAQKAEDKLADAERAARHAEEALASARKKLAASDLALASEHLAETLDGIRKEKNNADKLKEVGRRIYRDDLGTDLDSFTAAVSEASSIPGKVALVARVMIGGGLPTWLGAFAIVLIATAGIGWRLGDPTTLAVLLQRAIAWGGGTLAALGSLWQAVKLAKPVLDGAWAYAKAVEKARKDLAKEVEDKEVAARDAARALAEAQQKAKEAKAPLAKYGDGAAAGAPGTILRYFLFEDGDVRDYDKQVGLVSRARRSFEQLDAIFGAKRDGLAAKEKLAHLAPGKTLDPKEAEALKRYEAMQLDKQGLVIPDRIVLYIDDLDRCTHQQVYDVLQAIHLLLAFELFVVVVGVDVRWVEEAVARQFTIAADDLPDNATPEQREAARHKAETERRKRAIDYLEKIFQLPFWLRRLSTEGDRGGSYGAYVQELLQANLDVPENAPSPLAGTSGEPVLKTFAPGATPESETSPTGEVAPESLADASPTADELASVEMALATVRLTKEEVDFLASPEIGAIAFKSPRSVKRMLNVYRIVRARMSETELDEFLGRNGKAATWPMAALLAAVETGQPVEIADAVYDIVRDNPKGLFQFYLTSLVRHGSKPTEMPTHIFEAIKLVATSLPSFHEAVQKVQTIADPMGALLAKDYLDMARIVRRYSFNRYH
jgi:tetratricopeptide (TPR) repeat protein